MPKWTRVVFNNNVAYIYFRHLPPRTLPNVTKQSKAKMAESKTYENITRMTLRNYYNIQSTFIYKHNQSIIRSVTAIEAGSNDTTSFIGRLLVVTKIPIR